MIRATTAIILDKRVQKKDGTYSVKLRITHQRQQKYYPLNISLTEEDWEKIQLKNARGVYKEHQVYFNGIEKKAVDAIKELPLFTFQSFEKKFSQEDRRGEDVFSLFDDYIKSLSLENRHGNAAIYSTSSNSIRNFLNDQRRKKLNFEDITPQWLAEYEKWFVGNGNSMTSAGIYLRSLRTILNIAIERGLLPRDLYPFGKRKYQIPAGRKVKKSLTLTEIKQIVDYVPVTEAEERWRDLWMFCYLCNGANIKDVCKLKYKNVTKTSLTFIRSKTERSTKQDLKPIVVMLLPQIKKIINKWGVEAAGPETYVFGIITTEDSTIRQFKKIQQANKTLNKYMKRIGEELGIDIKLTTYAARHSFATTLKRAGAPTAFISESLGHQNEKTTDSYLGSFENSVKETYQKMLLDFEKTG
ncbi:site-specific integrase [Pedobacter sp. SYSU D00535]|uniref:site-specific integrase n=1 Tax=Pedobacter sp. SYSU D00535 TaxID=2810308 RepID=UPI001A973EA1|nr:site-specific integrase [Pedobacter sp. SYSU D00535]